MPHLLVDPALKRQGILAMPLRRGRLELSQMFPPLHIIRPIHKHRYINQ